CCAAASHFISQLQLVCSITRLGEASYDITTKTARVVVTSSSATCPYPAGFVEGCAFHCKNGALSVSCAGIETAVRAIQETCAPEAFLVCLRKVERAFGHGDCVLECIGG